MCRELRFNRLGHHSWLVVPVRDLLENGHFCSLLMMTVTSTTSGCWFGGWRRGLGLAVRTAPPVGDFGFFDLVALVVGRRETGRGTDRAVDVDDATADPADQVVVVVADAIFVARRRAGRLDAADQAFGDEQGERVVDGLQRDRADLETGDLGHAIGGGVGLARHRPQDRQALRRDLDAVFTEECGRVGNHESHDRSNTGMIQVLVEARDDLAIS